MVCSQLCFGFELGFVFGGGGVDGREYKMALEKVTPHFAHRSRCPAVIFVRTAGGDNGVVLSMARDV